MTKFDSFKGRMRVFKNDLAYNSLKLQLADCPNIDFNQYVLAFVKSFMKCGRIQVQKRYGIYTLFVHKRDYDGFVMIKNENGKKEITISLSPVLKNSSQFMKKKVTFDGNKIIMLDISKYEDSTYTLENTACSMFKNTNPINSLGENTMIYREISKRQTKNEKNEESTSLLRIRNNGMALLKMSDTRMIENQYFKAKDVFSTFEDVLKENFEDIEKEKPSSLKVEYISIADAKQFEDKWYNENYRTEEKDVNSKILSAI